jgi:hypothetical protein
MSISTVVESLRENLTGVKKKRNLYISYIKGVAIIGIILIHLIDWSDMSLSLKGRIAEDILLLCVFLFVLATGSVLLIAYEHRSSIEQIKRLLYRSGQILFFYYLYSIIKFLIFDFSTEPLYYQFINKGTLTIPDILMFRCYSVPIAILATYAFLLALSPLILLVYKKSRRPGSAVAIMIVGLFIINYFTFIPGVNSPIVNFLYAKDNVLFSILMWMMPLLIGFYLAHLGFEKQKRNIFLAGGLLTIISALWLFQGHKSLWLTDNEFPLSPYFIFCGIFALAILLYFFHWLEKISNKFIKGFLAALRLLGDNTLHIYIYQWIIIDCTRWIFPKDVALIWLTVPLFFVFYLLLRRKKLIEYYYHQKEATRDLGAEVL